MNRIVREQYPSANLPEDLREGLPKFVTVTISVEEDGDLTGLAAIEALKRRYERHWQEAISQPPFDIEAHRGKVTIEEAVARIRALRDEWDDE